MNKSELIVKNNIVRIVGVFDFPTKQKNINGKFEKDGYTQEIISDELSLKHYKNYWYPDFRDIYFLKKEETSATIFTKQLLDTKLDFVVRTNRETGEQIILETNLISAELFVFKEQLSFFTIELNIDDKKLSSISDLTFCARNFETLINTKNSAIKWVNWIEENILCGIKITSTSSNSKIKVDDYSGSKFKLFTVLDMEQALDQNIRMELLYDVGCVAQIGSAGGNSAFTPSDSYFDELMENKISVFNNYDILPLFDSFTVIGHHILDSNPLHFKNITRSQSYFRIYVHNLFIKYNLFQYNSEMSGDLIKVRDKFETFLNHYNFSHVSYSFLPNLIFQKFRISLDIDDELEKFQERINRISQSILEEKQNRSNLLLTIVGFVTSIGSIEPVFAWINGLKEKLHFNAYLFYTIMGVIIVSAGIPLLMFLFPDKTKLINRKWRERKNLF